MLKKIKKYSHYINSIIALLCFIIFMFVPIGGYKGNNENVYKANGISLTFGMNEGNYVIYNFDIFGIILMVLFLSCIILPFLMKKYGKWLIIVTAILMIITSIIFFIFPLTVQHASSYVKEMFIGLPFNYIGASLILLNGLYIVLFDLIKKEK